MKLSKATILALLACGVLSLAGDKIAFAESLSGYHVDVRSSASVEDEDDGDEKDKDDGFIEEEPEKPAPAPAPAPEPKPEPEKPAPKPQPKPEPTPAPKPTAPVVVRGSDLAKAFGALTVDMELDKYQGRLVGHDYGHRSVWARAFSEKLSLEKGDATVKGLQVGYNHPFAQHLGFYGPFVTLAKADLSAGMLTSDAKLLGLGFATRVFTEEGGYVDSWVQATRTSGEGQKTYVLAGSIEGGKRIALSDKAYIEPQGQLIASYHGAVADQASYGALKGRLSAKVGYSDQSSTVPYDLYAKATFRKGLIGAVKEDGRFSLALGGSAGFTHSTRGYFEVERQFSKGHFKAGWNFTAGLRANF